MKPRTRALAAALVGALALTSAACGDGDGPARTEGGPALTDDGWPEVTTPVATDGLIWADGSTVHLPDGSTIDTGRPAGAYVVAGPGVWFASADPDELEGNELPELRLATADGVVGTGAHPAIGSLMSSDDGRWLVFIDRLEDGAGPAEAVVIDAMTGREVARTSTGLVPAGADGDEDWTDLYEDAPVGTLGIVDGKAYVGGLDQLVTLDLSTGRATYDDLDWTAIRRTAWWRSSHRTLPIWNDDRTWQVSAQAFGAAPVLRSADGTRVTTSMPELTGPLGSPDLTGPPLDDWSLGGWTDAVTAVGITPSRDETGDEDWTHPALISCSAPSGECELVEGTENGVNLPVDRPFGLPRGSSLDPSG